MREEIKKQLQDVSVFVDESEDFIFENYSTSYTLFKSEIEDLKENLALIENSFETIGDESLERVKENLTSIKKEIKEIVNIYDADKLYVEETPVEEIKPVVEEIDVNEYLDSIEYIPEEEPKEEVVQDDILPNEFVQPYVDDAKKDFEEQVSEEPIQQSEVIDTPPVEPQIIEAPTPNIVMPTGEINLNSLDNIMADISPVEPMPVAQPQVQEPVQEQVVEPVVQQVEPTSTPDAFSFQPSDELNVQALDDLFNS